MSDPGILVMAVLLAVPVAVLLFVLVLALMGRRWRAAPVVVEESGQSGLVPVRPEVLIPAPQYGYHPPSWPLEPPHDPRPQNPYGFSTQDRYAAPAPRALPPAQNGAPPPVRNGALPSAPPVQNRALPAARNDAQDFRVRPAEPEPADQQGGFPYGPYRHY